MRADKSECFAYAGRYEIADGTVFHSIELSTNPTPDRLSLDPAHRGSKATGSPCPGRISGPAPSASQQIVWRRA